MLLQLKLSPAHQNPVWYIVPEYGTVPGYVPTVYSIYSGLRTPNTGGYTIQNTVYNSTPGIRRTKCERDKSFVFRHDVVIAVKYAHFVDSTPSTPTRYRNVRCRTYLEQLILADFVSSVHKVYTGKYCI